MAFREYMANYAESDRFTSLLAETKKLKADLVHRKILPAHKGQSASRFANYESEIDYSADVEKTFEKFKQGAVKDYRVKFPAWSGHEPC
ncbi:MAG: hypothetical protein M0C28_37405 [Candidatus Moduliflexus flocculans]|nr:hypothetical protein [Candidatus Moduliflexus flocculans]